MKYLFLSDLHMGHIFFDDSDKVIIMDLINDDSYDRIFFVGDTFDAWAMNIIDIRKKYKHVIDTINRVSEKKRIIILKGNHDPPLQVMRHIFPNADIVDRFVDDDFVVFHGDKYDPLLHKFDYFAKLFYPIHQWMAKKGIILNYFFRNLFHSFKLWRADANHNSVVMDIEKDAVVASNKTVVMGHTHIPKVVPNTYINCGDWTHNKSYVIYQDGNFRLINLRKNRVEHG